MCEITISEIIGISTPPSENPERIEVSGNVTDCKELSVTVNDSNPVIVSIEDGNGGEWTAIFHAGVHYNPQRFRCKETSVKVHAECVDDNEDCSDDADFILECRPDEVECPSVSLEILEVSDLCAPNETRDVQLKATVSNAPPNTVYTWDFGNGEEESALLTSNEIIRTQPYPADPSQTYISQFNFILPQGCEGAAITIGPLELCPPQCPEGEIIIEEGPSSDCINGKRRVTLSFSITAGNAFTAASIDFGDGSGQSPTITAAPGETVSSDTYLDEPIIHEYPAPETGNPPLTYTPQIVFAPEVVGCNPVVLDPPISIPPCESDCDSYAVTDIEITSSDCDDGKRVITASVITSGADSPSSYEWEWSDGQSETTNSNSTSREFEVPAEMNISVAVVVSWPNGCTDIQTAPFTIAPCEEEVICPEIGDITVTEGNCSTSGERPVTLTAQVTGQVAGNFTWDFGDGSTVTSSGPISPPHNYVPGTYSVEVTVPGPSGCSDESFSQEIEVTNCPNIPPPPPPPPPLCFILRILGLILLIIGLVLIFGGACSSNVPVAVTGGVIAAAGFIILVIWAIFCSRFAGGCRALQRMIEILALLEVFLGILSAIFGILSIFEIGIPCLIGSLIDTGIVGVLLAILNIIFAQRGCVPTRPTLIDTIFGIRASG